MIYITIPSIITNVMKPISDLIDSVVVIKFGIPYPKLKVIKDNPYLWTEEGVETGQMHDSI
jgi:hypothetical protein